MRVLGAILEYYETGSRTRSGYLLDKEFGHDIIIGCNKFWNIRESQGNISET